MQSGLVGAAGGAQSEVDHRLDGVRAPLLHRDFERRAHEIIDFINAQRPLVGLPEALTEAWERFVAAEPNLELRRFGEVIADARRQAVTQRRLDDDRERLHHGHLNHEELAELGHHYELLRYQACVYNHMLRGLIERHHDQFTRETLTAWLISASQGVRDWAVAEVTGSVSEVALHAALVGLPELVNLRYGTVEDDLKGYDFVADWQGALVTIDAKTGMYHPLTERKHGHRHLEISVPRQLVDDFRVTRAGLDLLRHEARQALRAHAGVRVHAAHHHYH